MTPGQFFRGFMALLALVGVVLLGYFAISDENLARESEARAYRNAIHYKIDRRTGFCFAYLSRHSQYGMATVKCTPKVMELIE